MSIIEKIYSGDYYPSEQTVPASQAYQEAQREMHAAFDRLNEQLPKPQQELLDEYVGLAADAHGYISMEAYRLGIEFGLELALELLR